MFDMKVYPVAMVRPLPCFVWVDVTNRWLEPYLGIMLARRRDPDRFGKPHWSGWVITAHEAGSAAHGFSVHVSQQWFDLAFVKPVEVGERPKPDLSGYRTVNSDRPG